MAKPDQQSFRDKLGIVFHPKNLLRTAATSLPVGAQVVEMLNQIEGDQLQRKLAGLESDLELQFKVHAFEKAQGKPEEIPQAWPLAVSQFARRLVTVAILYDGGIHSREERGKEFVQPVAHGCLVGDDQVLTCSEAIEMARVVAEHKHGRSILVAGYTRYAFETEAPSEYAGLVTCHITKEEDHGEGIRVANPG